MKIEIVYDNVAYREDMIADWGFSAYIDFSFPLGSHRWN